MFRAATAAAASLQALMLSLRLSSKPGHSRRQSRSFHLAYSFFASVDTISLAIIGVKMLSDKPQKTGLRKRHASGPYR